MKKRILPIILALLVLFTVVSGLLAWQSAQRCRRELSVAAYTVPSGLNTPVRIIQLSDLHGWTFGDGNADLAAQVEALEPDLIVMTGDMLDRLDENPDTVCELIQILADTAPIYYCYGNHEYKWMQSHGESLTPELEAAGATVLDTSYLDITLNGQPVRIGGYHGYYRQPGMYDISQEQREAELSFCDDFEDTDSYKLLLCHIPTPWLDWQYIDDCPVDLVLTGHYHGGQIRLPFIGGLYAPYIGIFPEYTQGLYTGEQATCILSAGLGASPGIPRINNLPQIVVVDLHHNDS